ncbi:hypothetical protein CORC01_05282 [Colletotrichum orchidophilum]|uniref:Uncharacterized protein n=1 Tax=Colletotrichum orchidophilum TaxID=1209926 RepID=A0A1G4BDR7_9PEZI|nr:uncharacterized protein CORC01_05282 [Colletotrichum orchidophilum]OHE99482.1 hypothetical protein CORC01_05282 [Colletotrichum orchidophilum]
MAGPHHFLSGEKQAMAGVGEQACLESDQHWRYGSLDPLTTTT